MDPRDESRLQDLLDDRLDDASAAALRERLAREPDLKETWEDLARIRDLVRGPAGERAPRDFLSRVRAGIEALPAGAEPEADAPRRPDQLAWRRAALAFSAVAALLLVALSVRLMVADRTPVLQGEMLDRAEAPDSELDALRLDEKRGEKEEASALGAPPPAAASSPVPEPMTTAGSARGGFRPGDQVPPGLRAPSDEVARSAPVPRRGLKGRSAPADRRDDDVATITYALEAEGLEEGRARLALVVAALDGPVEAFDGRGAAILLRGEASDELRRHSRIDLTAGAGGGGRHVLGSVLLTLTPEQAARLAHESLDGEAEEGVAEDGDAEAGVAKDRAERKGVPGRGKSASPPPPGAPAPDAEPEAAEEGGKKATRIRVRVFLVKPADDE